MNWNSTFVMADGNIDTLANLAKPYRDKITADMQRLKLSSLVTMARQNLFIRVPSSTVHVYVYPHQEYCSVKDVKFTSIARASKIQIVE